MHDHIKIGLDAAAYGTAYATFIGLLPSIASLLSIVWVSIQLGTWLHRTFIKGRE